MPDKGRISFFFFFGKRKRDEGRKGRTEGECDG